MKQFVLWLENETICHFGCKMKQLALRFFRFTYFFFSFRHQYRTFYHILKFTIIVIYVNNGILISIAISVNNIKIRTY